ncbi:MAG TPA: Tex-like N-terminal domain-containing protein, partial [bacterium]|nr:Tex-like N-terminal domain-containing protein [bacterium]
MSEQEILRLVAKELNIPVQHVTSTIQLLDLENTVPFIARY